MTSTRYAPRPEFAVHRLNAEGLDHAARLADMFTDLLIGVEMVCGSSGREMAICRTKLEEASFFAKKAMATRPEYQAQDRPPLSDHGSAE